MNTLNIEDSLILVIDIQEKLVNALKRGRSTNVAAKIVRAGKLLNIPILITEQYPAGLGSTIPQITKPLDNYAEIVEKFSFNALLEDGMLEKIKSYGKKQIVIFGIETHICVHQTASALVEEGFEVYVVKDGCASRGKYEFKQGIDRMRKNGVKITCFEIVMFEWLKTAKHPHFKEIQDLILS